MRGRLLGAASIAAAFALVSAASASAATLYVDDSGTDTGDCTVPATPCDTITYALGLAGTDTIHIGGGSYTEAVDINQSETLIEDSSFSGAAAGQAVLTSPPATTAVEYFTPGSVQGLTIRSSMTAVRFAAGGTLTGNTFDTSSLPTGPYGADVFIDAFSSFSPTITGNIFVDSVPDAQIGLVANSTGSPMISDNTFSGFNFAIYALQGSAASPTITGNQISGTQGSVGAAIVTGGAITPTITGNSIHSPGTGAPDGISIDSTGAATLSRNRVIGHDIGINVSGPSTTSLQSDLVVKSVGVGLRVESPTNGTNVTVADSGGAADVFVDGDVLFLDSSIVSGNPNGIVDVSGGACAITFSRGPTTSGGGCDTFQTSAAPGFANAAANDYHLGAGSPMIDMGDTATPLPGALDIDGDARALGVAAQCTTPPPGRRDMGADEFTAGCPPPVTPDPPAQPVKKKCKKGQQLKKGKCVKKKRKKRKK